MPYLLLLIYLINRILQSLSTKHNSSSFSRMGVQGSFLYTILTGIFSLFFYWALNGFKLSFTVAVVLYSMIYGAFVVLSLSLTIFMYNHGSMSLISFISGTVSLISSAVFGALILGENITPQLILRIALMLICVFTVFIGTKTSGAVEEQKRLSPLTFILPTLVALIGLAVTILIKFYLQDASSTDANSLYFMTNVFCTVYSVPILLVMMLKGKKKDPAPSEILRACVDKRCLGAFINTGIGAILTVIGTVLIEQMDVALYTPVTSALGFIAMAVVTPIVRERLDIYKISATVIAILSLFLPSLVFP